MKQLLLLAATWCLLCACIDTTTEEPKPDPKPNPDDKGSITLPDEAIAPTFNDQGGSTTIRFTATGKWNARIESTRAIEWCRIAPTSGGAGDVTLSVETDPNTSPDERNATITLATEGETRTIVVSQKQKDALTLSSSKIEMQAEGGTASIEVKANIEFKCEIAEEDQSWIKPSDTRAVTLSRLNFEIEANDKTTPRQGTITIQSSQGIETVNIYQAGVAPELVLTQHEYTIADTGATIAVELRSNVDYQVTLPAVDWISESQTRALSTHTRYFTILPNETHDLRTAEILFEDKSSGLAQTVIVTQVQKDAIVLVKSEFELEAEATRLTFEVLTNVEPKVEISSGARTWLTQVETRGLESRSLHFDVKQNTHPDNRMGAIFISNGNITQTVTITQQGSHEWLLLPDLTEMHFDSKGGVCDDLSFAALKPWSARIESTRQIDWCHITPTSGDAGRVAFSVKTDPNTSPDERNATITITAEGATKRIVVSQKQQDALTVSSAKNEIGAEGGVVEVEVKANIDFIVEPQIDCSGWVTQQKTRAMQRTLLAFDVKPNDKLAVRQGTIIIHSSQGTEVVKIYQEGTAPVLILTQKEYAVPYTGETIAVELQSNVEYQVTLPAVDWISEAQTRAISTHTRYFTLAPNEELDSRTAEILFTNQANGLAQTVTITQAQKNAIVLGQTAFKVEQPGGRVDVTLSSNFEYKVAVTTGDDWITRIDPTRAMTESTCSFQVAANETESPRTGVITFTDPVSGRRSFVNIKQAPTLVERCIELVYTISRPGYTDLHINYNGVFEGTNFKIIRVDYGDGTEHTHFNLYHTYDRPGEYVVKVYYNGTMTTINRGFSCSEGIYGWTVPLKSITIPESVTSIDSDAFCENSYLVKVTIEGHTKTYGNPFSQCKNLRTFEGPMASEDGRCLTHEGKLWAFAPAGITSYTIPTNAQIIGEDAFHSTQLTDITLPEGVVSIEENAFVNCHIRQLSLPSSLQSIGMSAFAGCEQLSRVSIPAQCTSLGRSCFRGCTSLTSVSLPEGITHIDAFWGCSSLPDITLPSSVTTIGDSAFKECTSLTSLILPENLTTIKNQAFEKSGLQTIRLGRNITKLAEGAFSGCASLRTVEFDPNIQIPIIEEDVFQRSGVETITIPRNVEGIENFAFHQCPNLKSVYFAEGSKLQRIYDGYSYSRGFYGAFAECPSLTTIELPQRINYIGVGAFAGTAIESITLPESTMTIAAGVFFECRNLKTITIPDYTLTIGKLAFYDCSALHTVSLGPGLKSVAADAFWYCHALKHLSSASAACEATSDQRCLVNAEGSLFAFAPIGAPKAYTVPSSTKSFTISQIASLTFSGCISSSITLPETLTAIGKDAFSRLKNLSTLYFQSPTPPLLYITSGVTESSIGGWMVGSGNDPLPSGSCKFYVPAASVEAYRTEKHWKDRSSQIIGY